MPGNKTQLITDLESALAATRTKTIAQAAQQIADAIDSYVSTIKARVPASSFCAQAQSCVPNAQLDLDLI